jgi:hypothetical protein
LLAGTPAAALAGAAELIDVRRQVDRGPAIGVGFWVFECIGRRLRHCCFRDHERHDTAGDLRNALVGDRDQDLPGELQAQEVDGFRHGIPSSAISHGSN